MRNAIQCFPFSEDDFKQAIRSFLEIGDTTWSTDQIDYLSWYLADDEVKAATVVLEEHYVDRHYMEEFSMYYAKCLSPPRNFCARFHLFSKELSEEDIERVFAVPDSDPSLGELERSYLGFIVIRPLVHAPVGRTMLKPYPAEALEGHDRSFDPVIPASTHLGSIELKVEGLPFQQQDRRVGACATAAVWSALARVVRTDGGRSPTPAGITEAAVRFFLPDGRAYPSDGLRLEQICEALRSHGSSPELLKVTCECSEPCAHPVTHGALIRGYLRSGIPVILSLVPLEEVDAKDSPDGKPLLVVSGSSPHAVCAVGYSDKSQETVPAFFRDYDRSAAPLVWPAASYAKLYVHDDRNGPYTRAPFWRSIFHEGDLPSRGLVLKLMDDAPWVISHAVVPLYPKVRTSLTELFLAGTDWVGWLSDTLQLPEKSIRLDARMMRSGDYLAALRRGEPGVLPPGLVARFAREACLSRYVGVVEYSVGDERVADLLWDTTDRVQQGASARLLSGAVLYRDAYRTEFQQLLPSDIAVV